jgi:hypothetical protein
MTDSTSQPASGSAPTPILDILSDSDLSYLRSQYDEQKMVDTAKTFGSALYPNAAPWVDFLTDYFFQPPLPKPPNRSALSALDREVLLVGLLTAKFQGTGAFLCIHFYWGLMVGMSVQQVADSIMLSSMYSGINVNNAAMVTFDRLLHLLKGFCSPQQQADAVTVSTAILKTFA